MSRRCGRPLGVGFSAVLPMASPVSSFSRHQQSPALSRSALRARDALVLEHLPLADAIASVAARRLFPLVEREDLIQVAREALVRSAPRCRAGEPAGPYLRRCIAGALQHHLRDRVRLVRISRREHEKGTCPLGHTSLDAQVDGEHSLLDQLEAPAAELASGSDAEELALEQLVEQLPAAQPPRCGSPCWRASRCAPPGSSWASAPWPCSEPRRRPSQPCACSWWVGAEGPEAPACSFSARPLAGGGSAAPQAAATEGFAVAVRPSGPPGLPKGCFCRRECGAWRELKMQATSMIWLSRCPSEKGDNTAQPKAQERPSEGAEACAQSRQPRQGNAPALLWCQVQRAA